MYNKLEDLNRLNNAMNEIVANVDRCNEQLVSEYKKHEEMRLSKFMDAMSELASYAKNLSYPHFVTDIVFDVERSSYGDRNEVLIFDFKKDGNFIIQTNCNTNEACIYASMFAECGKQSLIPWNYGSYAYFDNGWGYSGNKHEIDKSKKFIAIHASEILYTVQKMIEDRFDREIKAKANKAYKKQARLIADIERVKK